MKHLLTIALLATLLHSTASSQTIRLTFVGDAMQHGPQIRAARTADGNHDYSACFIHLASDIADADFAVVNLECPLGGKPYSGSLWGFQLGRDCDRAFRIGLHPPPTL